MRDQDVAPPIPRRGKVEVVSRLSYADEAYPIREEWVPGPCWSRGAAGLLVRPELVAVHHWGWETDPLQQHGSARFAVRNGLPAKGKSMIAARLTTVLALLFALPVVQAADNLKAFPPAEEGMVRFVLQLPKRVDESVYRVELIVGKTVQVDARNRFFFGGRIEQETIKGWGYTRYKVAKLGPMAGTLMAIEPDEPKVDRFITLAGEPYLVRYNSRLPIVVYVPEGVEVRYRIWSAGAEARTLEKG
jgi:ecotin